MNVEQKLEQSQFNRIVELIERAVNCSDEVFQDRLDINYSKIPIAFENSKNSLRKKELLTIAPLIVKLKNRINLFRESNPQ